MTIRLRIMGSFFADKGPETWKFSRLALEHRCGEDRGGCRIGLPLEVGDRGGCTSVALLWAQGVGVAPRPLQGHNRLFLTGGRLVGQMGALRPLLSHLWRGSATGQEAVQQPHPSQWGQVLRGSEGEVPILQPGALPQLR